MCCVVQVWNHNLVVDTFLGQISVPIPGDGESHTTSERYGRTIYYILCWCLINGYIPHLVLLQTLVEITCWPPMTRATQHKTTAS